MNINIWIENIENQWKPTKFLRSKFLTIHVCGNWFDAMYGSCECQEKIEQQNRGKRSFSISTISINLFGLYLVLGVGWAYYEQGEEGSFRLHPFQKVSKITLR